MTRLNMREMRMPIAAFTMVFVLGGYIYHSIGAAKANAAMEREKKFAEIMKQRQDLGMDLPRSFKRSG